MCGYCYFGEFYHHCLQHQIYKDDNEICILATMYCNVRGLLACLLSLLLYIIFTYFYRFIEIYFLDGKKLSAY